MTEKKTTFFAPYCTCTACGRPGHGADDDQCPWRAGPPIRMYKAAPDLLAALRELAPAADAMLGVLNGLGIENGKAKRGCRAIAAAYAAISQATGDRGLDRSMVGSAEADDVRVISGLPPSLEDIVALDTDITGGEDATTYVQRLRGEVA